MLRIIGGKFKGRRLETPAGLVTRPMPDRARESLFAVIEPRLANAAVLDLYCGCGGLGLEALSRGARHATFVEANAAVAAILRKNVERLDLAASACRIVAAPAARALEALRTHAVPFNIIFMDPPFADLKSARGRSRLTAELLAAATLLCNDGLIIFRMESDAIPLETGGALGTEREKLYGRSRVIVLALRPAEQARPE